MLRTLCPTRAVLLGMILPLTVLAAGAGWMSFSDDGKLAKMMLEPVQTVHLMVAPPPGGAKPPAKAPPVAPPPTASAPPDTAPAAAKPEVAAPPASVPAAPIPEGEITLVPAPAPGLAEETRNGMLPIVAADGRKPWQVYARPFRATEKRARIAVLVTRLGLSGAVTSLALQQLPPEVTLGFVPFGDRVESWMAAARGQGHEVLLSVPMEPINYPHDDTGPNTLLVMFEAARNLDRLEWALGRGSGYVGIVSGGGSRFTAEAGSIRPVLEVLKKRGLLYLDPRTTLHSVAFTAAKEVDVPRAWVNLPLDVDLSRGGIDAQLKALEAIALRDGVAVGITEPYPTVIERIAQWVPLLSDRKISIAPVSAVVNVQQSPPPPPAPPTGPPAKH